MVYLSYIFILIQIYFAYKYLNKLKDTDERLKDNEIDYSEIKLKLQKLNIEYDNLKLRYIDLVKRIEYVEDEIKPVDF